MRHAFNDSTHNTLYRVI